MSRFGLLAFASSLDQIGPFAITVDDAAAVLAVIAGHDGHDATSTANAVPDFTGAAAASDARGLRIGVPRAFIAGVDPAVAQAFDAALATWTSLGATVVDIALPNAGLAIPVYYLIATAEASSNLARYDGARYGYRTPLTAKDSLREMYERTRDEGFGAEVKRRIMLGTYVLSAGYYDAYYLKAQQVRAKVRDDYAAAFATVDVVATPTTPDAGVQAGREDGRPAADVPGRHLHGEREPGRRAGHEPAVRALARRPADWVSAHGAHVGRSHVDPRWRGLPAGHRLAPARARTAVTP